MMFCKVYMKTPEAGTVSSFERNEQRKQDVMFVRSFLRQMDQTRVLRWRKEGDAKVTSAEEVTQMKESDAEHTGQMTTLATFLLLKARNENDGSIDPTFDSLKLFAMIQLHDLEENRVGDARDKDETYYAKEKVAHAEIVAEVEKMNFGDTVLTAMTEYKERSSKEARLAKALDELQAWFYLVYTRQFAESTRDFTKPHLIEGYARMSEFPTVKRIGDIVLKILQNPKLISEKTPQMQLIEDQYTL